jgi:hypothetical protein
MLSSPLRHGLQNDPGTGNLPAFALFRRGSRVSEMQLDGLCIILFCGMLPLIWSFDHFYFRQVQRIPEVHGRPA